MNLVQVVAGVTGKGICVSYEGRQPGVRSIRATEKGRQSRLVFNLQAVSEVHSILWNLGQP